MPYRAYGYDFEFVSPMIELELVFGEEEENWGWWWGGKRGEREGVGGCWVNINVINEIYCLPFLEYVPNKSVFI